MWSRDGLQDAAARRIATMTEAMEVVEEEEEGVTLSQTEAARQGDACLAALHANAPEPALKAEAESVIARMTNRQVFAA